MNHIFNLGGLRSFIPVLFNYALSFLRKIVVFFWHCIMVQKPRIAAVNDFMYIIVDIMMFLRMNCRRKEYIELFKY